MTRHQNRRLTYFSGGFNSLCIRIIFCYTFGRNQQIGRWVNDVRKWNKCGVKCEINDDAWCLVIWVYFTYVCVGFDSDTLNVFFYIVIVRVRLKNVVIRVLKSQMKGLNFVFGDVKKKLFQIHFWTEKKLKTKDRQNKIPSKIKKHFPSVCILRGSLWLLFITSTLH